MNILMLGGTGYLGGNLVHKLTEENHHLFCVTRVSSDTRKIERLKNITFISSDINEIEINFRHSHIEWVINTACSYRSNDSLYGDLLMSNILFPLEVFNLALKYDVRNYITIGTSLPEETNLYSFTKHKYGEFGRFICRENRINFADLKLEMFYGGLYEPEDRFISSCKKKLLKNEPISLTSGTQKRDIIRVEDVVSIINNLISKSYLTGYMSLPIGSGEQHSIIELLEFMKTIMGSQSELRFGEIPQRRVEPNTLADIKWYDDIDYKLQYSYFEGLKDECQRG